MTATSTHYTIFALENSGITFELLLSIYVTVCARYVSGGLNYEINSYILHWKLLYGNRPSRGCITTEWLRNMSDDETTSLLVSFVEKNLLLNLPKTAEYFSLGLT